MTFMLEKIRTLRLETRKRLEKLSTPCYVLDTTNKYNPIGLKTRQTLQTVEIQGLGQSSTWTRSY